MGAVRLAGRRLAVFGSRVRRQEEAGLVVAMAQGGAAGAALCRPAAL